MDFPLENDANHPVAELNPKIEPFPAVAAVFGGFLVPSTLLSIPNCGQVSMTASSCKWREVFQEVSTLRRQHMALLPFSVWRTTKPEVVPSTFTRDHMRGFSKYWSLPLVPFGHPFQQPKWGKPF